VAILRDRFVASVAALGLSAIVVIALGGSPVGAAGSSTTVLHFFGVQESLTVTTATGQPQAPTDLFPVGDHYDGTDLLYLGQHQRHAPRFSASDHVACVITVSSAVAERQTCSQQYAIGSAMLLATNVTLTFNGRTASIPINGGTGRFKNARGTLVSSPVGNSTDTDNTFTLTGVASGPTAVPFSAGTTLPFYSVQQTLKFSTAAGQPISDANTAGPGDRYDSTDLYYAGTHAQHAAGFSASDHLACTFNANDTQTCNNQIAINGSLLLLNNVTEPSSGTAIPSPINAGTGIYENARGTFVTGADTVTTDVTITLTG
jgi:hypothetical protein